METTKVTFFAILITLSITLFLSSNLAQNASGKDDIKSLIDKGNALLDSGKYEEAITYYDKALDIDPNDVEALINKGWTLHNLGKYEEAITYYDKALDVDHNDVDALNNKGLALHNLGKYEEAITYYDKALDVDPNYAYPLNNKGWALHNLGKYEEAITYYDKALDVDPNYVEALNNKGAALYDLGKHEEAITYYDKALDVDPNFVDALNNKGFALYNLGRSQEAVVYFDKALEKEPNNTRVLINKGGALLDLKKFYDVIDVNDKVLEKDPENILALVNKGSALDELGRIQDAIVLYDKVLDKDPDNIYALTNKGVSLHHLGKYEEAIELYDRVLNLNPDDVEASKNKELSLNALNMRTESKPSSQESDVNVECGQKVRNNVTLTSDLDCTGSGLVVDQDNTIINLNGHSIIGPGPGENNDNILDANTGIVAPDLNNTVIQGPGSIHNYDAGVLILRASNSEVNKITFEGNKFGVFISDSTGSTIEQNFIDSNTIGVASRSSTGAQIQTNNFTDNDMAGVTFVDSQKSQVDANSIRGSNIGVYLDPQSNKNIISYNDAKENDIDLNNADGLPLSANDNEFIKNNCFNSTPSGGCQALLDTSLNVNLTQSSANPTSSLPYENSTYGIKVQYPSDWTTEGGNASSEDEIFPIVYISPPISSDPNDNTNFQIGYDSAVDPNGFSLDQYVRDAIEGQRADNESSDFRADSVKTDINIANRTGYSLVSTRNVDGVPMKSIELGTLVGDKVYYILFDTEASKYNTFLPDVEKMIDSFELVSYEGTHHNENEKANGTDTTKSKHVPLDNNSNTSFQNYENSKYGLKVQYPSTWMLQGDQTNSEDDILRTNIYAPKTSNGLSYVVIGYDPSVGKNISLEKYVDDSVKADKKEGIFNVESVKTDSNLAGRQAYTIILTNTADGTDRKSMEVGTLIGNKHYYILFDAEKLDYNALLPDVQKMIDSFEIIGKEANENKQNVSSVISPSMLSNNQNVTSEQIVNSSENLTAGSSVPTSQKFTTMMSGGEEVPQVDTDASGVATFIPLESVVKYDVNVTGISKATEAHIHLGNKGENGYMVVDLLEGGEHKQTENGITIKGNIMDFSLVGPLQGMTTADLIHLMNGGGLPFMARGEAGEFKHLYVNVHTENHPDGEIRGQIS